MKDHWKCHCVGPINSPTLPLPPPPSDGVITEKLCPDGMVFNDFAIDQEKCDLPNNLDCSQRPKLRKWRGEPVGPDFSRRKRSLTDNYLLTYRAPSAQYQLPSTERLLCICREGSLRQVLLLRRGQIQHDHLSRWPRLQRQDRHLHVA